MAWRIEEHDTVKLFAEDRTGNPTVAYEVRIDAEESSLFIDNAPLEESSIPRDDVLKSEDLPSRGPTDDGATPSARNALKSRVAGTVSDAREPDPFPTDYGENPRIRLVLANLSQQEIRALERGNEHKWLEAAPALIGENPYRALRSSLAIMGLSDQSPRLMSKQDKDRVMLQSSSDRISQIGAAGATYVILSRQEIEGLERDNYRCTITAAPQSLCVQPYLLLPLRFMTSQREFRLLTKQKTELHCLLPAILKDLPKKSTPPSVQMSVHRQMDSIDVPPLAIEAGPTCRIFGLKDFDKIMIDFELDLGILIHR